MLTTFLPSTHHCRARVHEEVGKVMNIKGHFDKKQYGENVCLRVECDRVR